MAKVVTIIKDDSITGVCYGTVEVPETPTHINRAQRAFKKAQSIKATKMRSERTKKK